MSDQEWDALIAQMGASVEELKKWAKTGNANMVHARAADIVNALSVMLMEVDG